MENPPKKTASHKLFVWDPNLLILHTISEFFISLRGSSVSLKGVLAVSNGSSAGITLVTNSAYCSKQMQYVESSPAVDNEKPAVVTPVPPRDQ